MPTLSKEQLADIELDYNDLFDQLEAAQARIVELEADNEALKEALNRVRKERDG